MLRPLLLLLAVLCYIPNAQGQYHIQVSIDSGFSATSCTDNFFGGAPDPRWRVNIASQGWSTFPQVGLCFNNTPIVRYNESFGCLSSLPSQLDVCFRALEDDGGQCIIQASCQVELCQTFSVPVLGQTISDSVVIPNNGSNASWGTVYFSITLGGGPRIGVGGNDLICGAIDLGHLDSGSVGNAHLSQYSNYCASNLTEPQAWAGTNEQGVWFSFTTGDQPLSSIEIIGKSDPQHLGDDIDLQLAVFELQGPNCSDSLVLVKDEYQGLGLMNDESLTFYCPKPNTTYYLLVDGQNTFSINPNGQEGIFGLSLVASPLLAAGRDICSASDLGPVPDGAAIFDSAQMYTNSCGLTSPSLLPAAWTASPAAWFTFETPASGNVLIEAWSDQPRPVGTDAIDLQLILWASSNDSCDGQLQRIKHRYRGNNLNESLPIQCLDVNRRYYLMVQGSPLNPTGNFRFKISDAGTDLSVDTAIDQRVVCDSLLWLDGQRYFSDNNSAIHLLSTVNGCDSVLKLDLTVLPSHASHDSLFLCLGDSVFLGGQWVQQSGFYADTLQNQAGCDSTHNIYLAQSGQSCQGDTIHLFSDSSWLESTVIIASNWLGQWPGGAPLPVDSSYQLSATVGQPYPWGGLKQLPGAEVIVSQADIHFFRKHFWLDDPLGLSAEIQMYMDDGCELYLNGTLLCREENMDYRNAKTSPHQLQVTSAGQVINGPHTFDGFDYHLPQLDLDTLLKTGNNQLDVVIRNPGGGFNRGGFSLALNLLRLTDSLVPSKKAVTQLDRSWSIYPNPGEGIIQLHTPENFGHGFLEIFDIQGRLVRKYSIDGPEIELDISMLSQGAYLIKLSNEKRQWQKRYFKR